MVGEVHHRLHYFRPGLWMSWRRFRGAAVMAAALAPLCAWSQYVGQVSKKGSDAPELRAVAVLEWTGEPGKPKACRIVPVSIFDGEKLQDAGLYLARPEPLALDTEVEYLLKQNGKTIGVFEVKNAGQEEGSWVGHGDWKPVPKPKPAFAAAAPDIDDEDDDKPVLHRKKHPDEQGSASTTSTASADSDRPKLHKKDNANTPGNAGSTPSDPDRPTLHKSPAKESGNDSDQDRASVDPDRPTLKQPKPDSKPKQPTEDIGHVDSLPSISDPDRPRLERGKPANSTPDVLPTLMGLPSDMQQAVGVSDPRNRPDHPWTFSWANPDDEAKMKQALEEIARKELGLTPPAAAVPPAAPRRAGTRRPVKPTPPPADTEPAELHNENFRVFELAYGSGATLVLTADTGGAPAQEKFVTLIAQPDLYGSLIVLYKNVTDGSHLDENPRMRLVDAVDAMADNRGELLFELRSATSRQFALFRVLRGTAEKLFVTSGSTFGTMSSN